MAERLRIGFIGLGFIGLGFMGHGMAANVLKQGFPLTVMARRKRHAVDDLVPKGAVEVATAADLDKWGQSGFLPFNV